jgi:flagellar biosynthesis protein FlhG
VAENLDIVYKQLFLDKEKTNHISVLLAGTEHVGTSWCGLSLAHALNLMSKKVLLVDGNGNFSNISTYIALQNPLYLDDYGVGFKTLNQLITAYKNRDFNILTAFPGNNYLEHLPLGRIHILINDLMPLIDNYQHTLIDIGSDISEKNLAFCHIAKSLIFVLSPKSSDLVKTFELIQFLHKNEIKAKYNLIINKVNSFEDGYKIFKELSKATEKYALSQPNLLGIVRNDTRVRDTIRNRELLLSRYPTSEAAIDINNIAQKLITEQCNG